jgi:hypothetical protein
MAARSENGGGNHSLFHPLFIPPMHPWNSREHLSEDARSSQQSSDERARDAERFGGHGGLMRIRLNDEAVINSNFASHRSSKPEPEFKKSPLAALDRRLTREFSLWLLPSGPSLG